MGKTNEFLEKQYRIKQKCFEVGCDTTAQQMFDMMCLVLNDPEIMGKDTFGAERLKKIHKALYEREKQFHEAWAHTQESDYYQEKLDISLIQIFGEVVPFKERYPFMKEWNYNKPSIK